MATEKGFVPNEAARRASEYFNSLPFEEREKLAPLLEHSRQMGMAEALQSLDHARRKVSDRIATLQAPRLEKI